jgi:hypothetical protein
VISSPILPRERELSLAHAQRFSFLIMEQCCSPLAVESIPGTTAISVTLLPRERELRLAHAQRCSFLIMEHCCSPLAVEIFPGKQECTSISAPILPRERELSLAYAQRCTFLIKEQRCGPLAIEMVPGKHSDFSPYIAKRARDQSGACAEMQFPDYGTELWSPGYRSGSKKAL